MRYAKNTRVPVDRSRVEIEKVLVNYGADKFMYMSGTTGAAIAFSMANRNIKILVPLPDRGADQFMLRKTRGDPTERAQGEGDRLWEKEVKRRWRALLLVIKAKLEAVESGIAEFEMEFMPYMVLPGGQTVGEKVLPNVQEAYDSGKKIPLLGPGT